MITSDLTTDSLNPVERALEEFRKKVLEPYGVKFLIVGSLALHKLGMEVDEPHDIDMEVICTPEQEQNIFKWGDRLINVWVVTEFSHTYIQLSNGICYAQVMSVIRKKIAYQRNKDRAFLVNLAYRFLGMCGANGKRTSAVFTPDR